MKKILAILFVFCVFSLQAEEPNQPELAKSGSETAKSGSETVELSSLTQAQRTFSFEILNALATEKKEETNISVAPMTLFLPLSMLAMGADGETQEQMLGALHLDAFDSETKQRFRTLREFLNLPLETSRIFSASRFFADARWSPKLSQNYQKDLRTFFNSEVELLEIQDDPEAARAKINEWTALQTFDRIPNAFPPGALTPDTRFVLAATLYFEAKWLHPFKPDQTRPDDFHLLGGKTKKARFMNQSEAFKYYENDDFQVVFLPYREKAYEMILVLPKKPEGLADVRKKLNEEVWETLLSEQKLALVTLSLPRFQTKTDVSLVPALKALGMTDLFSEETADLSGIDASGTLFLQMARMKTFLEVDEEGTIATAAFGMGGGFMGGPREVTFQADHPFLFFIRDVNQNVILFAGQLCEP